MDDYPPARSNHQTTVIIVFCVIALILTTLLRGNSILTPFERDEGEYAYSARLLLHGEVPYVQSFLQKPPLIIYVYALGQLVDPHGIWPPRIIGLVFVWLTAMVVGYIASREYGLSGGVTAMLVTPVMLSFPYLAGLAANTEIFMLLPLVITIALYQITRRDRIITIQYLLAGASAMGAVLFKPIAIFPLAVLFTVWFVQTVRTQRSLPQVIRIPFLWSAGGLAVLALSVVYFIYRGAGPRMLESVVEFNTFYIGTFGWGVENILFRMSVFFTRWTILIPILIAGGTIYLRRMWVQILMMLACIPTLVQTPIGHYYLILMPMGAVLLAGGVTWIAQMIDRRSEVVISIALALIVVVYMIANVAEQFGKSPEEMGVWVYGTGNPFAESMTVAQKVQELTSPDEQVFVAGSEPQILYYAGRQSVTRFVITYPFVIKSPRQAEYQLEAIRDIEHSRPAVIVLSRRPESGLWDHKSPPDLKDFLIGYLGRYYSLVGATVYDTDTFTWRDNPTTQEIDHASLLVFTHN